MALVPVSRPVVALSPFPRPLVALSPVSRPVVALSPFPRPLVALGLFVQVGNLPTSLRFVFRLTCEGARRSVRARSASLAKAL